MCIDYTNLNRELLKDLYPLQNIDKLVENSFIYKLLPFVDAYSNYNQIPMYKLDREKISFMIERSNYQYNVMPFSLKVEGRHTRG